MTRPPPPAAASPSLARRTGVAFAGLALAAACSSSTSKPHGELVVALSTELSIPKDMDELRVQVIRADGTALPERLLPILPWKLSPIGTPLPTTFSITPSDAGGQKVLVRVAAQHHHPDDASVVDNRVVREAITQVPDDRTALLEMPLRWLCDGMVQRIAGTDSYRSSCKEGDTCISGTCAPADIDTSALPEYTPASVYGGGDEHGNGSTCLDVQTCFAASVVEPLPSSGACQVPLPSAGSATSLNVAMVLPPNSDGHCVDDPVRGRGQGTCYLPIDRDPAEGFHVEGSEIVLPGSVCQRASVQGIAVSTSCPAKNPSIPVCGPWTGWANANGAGGGGVTDAGLPDASRGSGGADASTGAGGATGVATGGVTGSGGTASSGGATSNGGATGAGGTTGSGGATSSGGATGAGGTTGSGGDLSGGGATSSGGSDAGPTDAGAAGSSSSGGATGGSDAGVCTAPVGCFQCTDLFSHCAMTSCAPFDDVGHGITLPLPALP